ncbi:RNA ligase family protein [Nonomuraea basaltis]|uniref:RNA ligase family protein n=1 Tax=Nonomuraea basaltis TaxID=2495887 RepID=UPI00110C50A8|nr:RNA ligase family protein [Nonomuraea basaltis]TMR91308.1 hypothetical protein EJK15_50860 [Nonomuraea basaltis]
MLRIADVDLRVINSLTKYPSIPTHHRLDPNGKGSLLEEPTVFPGPVIATEKVDGTNARIVMHPSGCWFIGSRDELLTARGDRVANPSLGIVETLRPLADRIARDIDAGELTVYYLEVYGSKKLPAWKQYGQGESAYRVFDVAIIDRRMLAWEIQRVAAWRDGGGQEFLPERDLIASAAINSMPLTPRLLTIDGSELPPTVEGMRAFLEPFTQTRVATTGVAGSSEGVVLRTPDRSLITKARFQDYDRTLKRRAGQR